MILNWIWKKYSDDVYWLNLVYSDQLFWTHNDAVFPVNSWNFLTSLAANSSFKDSNIYEVIYYNAYKTLRLLYDPLKKKTITLMMHL